MNNQKAHFAFLAAKLSKSVTKEYSTSFYNATKLLSSEKRDHIYAVYALVRVADEIVDTFRPKNMQAQLEHLQADVLQAIESKVSTNPIVYNFAQTAAKYRFPAELISAFFESMKSDIRKKNYSKQESKSYIYGSAEVVGLMCLLVFVNGNKTKYTTLKPAAQALGSAFQKINFLRDIRIDSIKLGRTYFPNTNVRKFSDSEKQKIVIEIQKELNTAKQKIKTLPVDSRYGVLLALMYYQRLLHNIQRSPVSVLKSQRIRVSDGYKLYMYNTVRFRKLFHV